MKKTRTAALAAVAALASLGIHSSAFAFDGTTQSDTMRHRGNRPNTAIDNALTHNDYAAFTAATAGKPRPVGAPDVTQAVFTKMVEAHTLRAAGKHAEAEKIMNDLGFKKPNGGDHRGLHTMPQNLTDAQKTAWTQAETLFTSNKPDEAKTILDAAGIKQPARGAMMPRNRTDAQKQALAQAKTLFDANKGDEAKKVLDAAGITPLQHGTRGMHGAGAKGARTHTGATTKSTQ